jgi:hypothetical protein
MVTVLSFAGEELAAPLSALSGRHGSQVEWLAASCGQMEVFSKELERRIHGIDSGVDGVMRSPPGLSWLEWLCGWKGLCGWGAQMLPVSAHGSPQQGDVLQYGSARLTSIERPFSMESLCRV